MRQVPPAYSVDSVDRALRLLIALRREGSLRVSDAADEIGAARSTAHRLLAMLRYHGFVVQGADRIYRPGPMLTGGGQAPDAAAIVRERLETLQADVNETVTFVILTGPNIRFTESIEGAHMLRAAPVVGAAMPAYFTAGGRAILAELTDARALRLFPRLDDAGRRHFLEHLHQTRIRGYSINVQESEDGLTAIGACARRSDGRVLGAVCIAVPSIRYPRDTIREFSAMLLQTTSAIRADLERAGI